MKKVKKIIPILLLCATILSSCGGNNQDIDGIKENINTSFELDASEMFSDKDKDTTYSDGGAVRINLTGATAECQSDKVDINGSQITVKTDGEYIISGSLTDGRITVDAPEGTKPHIILAGVDIASTSASAFVVKECDKLIITLAQGSENKISATGEAADEDGSNIDGALFSKQDLSINGEGKLSVNSGASHAIVCKDDLVLAGGEYTLSAASHAIDANDSIRIASSTLKITSGNDGLHAENSDDATLGYVYLDSGSISATCGGDAISSGAHIQINGGSYVLASAEVSAQDSKKGIKSVGTLLINGGEFDIDATDDAIHSNTSIVINGGNFTLTSGDDGIHADESLYIGCGVIAISNSYEGLEALDIEIAGGDITIRASDDGINAAGGNDESGFGGSFGGGDKFGGARPGGPGGHGGAGAPGGMGGSSDGSILISGGKIYMNAYGDGIDANGSLTITGGEVTVCGPTSGDTSVLDYDNSATISGGTFIGTGAQMMAQTFSESSQGVIALTVGSRSAGTKITLTDSEGSVIVEYTPALPYQLVVISTPDMKKGESYTITVGEDSGTFEAN